MRVVSYTRNTSCLFGEKTTANGIGQQNEMISLYAKGKAWKIERRYSDRKIDADADDAFQQLLSDGMKRQFDLVIVSSIYRTGRDLGTAYEVLYKTFHLAGIWFAVCEDDFCSAQKSNQEVEEYFKTKYEECRILTINRKTAVRNENGILWRNDLRYGYRLDKNCHMVPDEKTAQTVVRLFTECAQGKSLKRIAEDLISDRIPCPLYEQHTARSIEDPYKWTTYGIKRIIRSSIYLGSWSKKRKDMVHQMECVPLVSQELFDAANKMIPYNPSTAVQTNKNMFSGYVLNLIDGGEIRFLKHKRDQSPYYSVSCGEPYHRAHIPYEEVLSAVQKAIEHENLLAEQACLLIRQGKFEVSLQERVLQSKARLKKIGQALGQLEKQRVAISRESDIEDRAGTLAIIEAEYKERERAFSEELKMMADIRVACSVDNPWLKLFRQYQTGCAITKQVLKQYLERIILSANGVDQVVLKKQNWKNLIPIDWRAIDGTKEQEKL